MNPDLLRRRWRSVTGRPVPPRLPVSLMIRILMWQEQIAQVGDLDPAYLARLNALAGGYEDEPVGEADGARQRGSFSGSYDGKRSGQPSGNIPGKSSSRRTLHQLRPGTILVREHAGALHRVMVLTAGFAWNGQTYPSLSRVARAITGTSWNGHRFFGLGKTRTRVTGGRASPDHGEAAPARRSREAPP